MKSIAYRGGVVTFRIPDCWQEEYSDTDGGMFYEDRPDSGTLRLNVITMTTPVRTPPPSASEILQVVVKGLSNDGVEGAAALRKDGNAIFRYEQISYEKATRLKIYFWVVSNPLPPKHARIANFSYTVPAKNQNLPSTLQDLKMLDSEIENASFSSNLGFLDEE